MPQKGAPKLSKAQLAYLAELGMADTIPQEMLPEPEIPAEIIDAIQAGNHTFTHQGKSYRRKKVTYISDDATTLIVAQWHNGNITATIRSQYDATLPSDFASWQQFIEATCDIKKQGKHWVIQPKKPYRRSKDAPFKSKNPISAHNCRTIAGRWDLVRRYNQQHRKP